MTPFNPRPWSHSRAVCAKECLHRFYLQYVLKLPSLSTEATLQGQRRHKQFADMINGSHKELVAFTAEERAAWEKVEHLTRGGKAEVFYAIDLDGDPEKDRKGYFMLGYLDLVHDAMVIDWKTGGSMWADEAQREWYATLFFAWKRPVWPVIVSFVFPFAEPERAEAPSDDVTYIPDEIPPIFERIRDGLLDLEEEILSLDPGNADEWTPNFKACGGCLQWSRCRHFNRRIVWPEKAA